MVAPQPNTRPRCRDAECSSEAVFGPPGASVSERTHCAAHHREGEVRLRRKCWMDGCNNAYAHNCYRMCMRHFRARFPNGPPDEK